MKSFFARGDIFRSKKGSPRKNSPICVAIGVPGRNANVRVCTLDVRIWGSQCGIWLSVHWTCRYVRPIRTNPHDEESWVEQLVAFLLSGEQILLGDGGIMACPQVWFSQCWASLSSLFWRPLGDGTASVAQGASAGTCLGPSPPVHPKDSDACFADWARGRMPNRCAE